MSLNKAMLIGRLGGDPEVRYTKSGDAVASFSMATDESWKDAQGNRQDKTEWHNIVAWAKLASFAQTYLKKGREVYLEGRLQTQKWTDKDNVTHYKTQIKADVIRFVGPKPDGEAPPSGQPQSGGDDNMEDDIPF